MAFDRIRRWRWRRFWNIRHMPLEHSGEDMAAAFSEGVDRREDNESE